VEFVVGKNLANNGDVAQVDIAPADNKKLTKRELLELADFFYSRYQQNKKSLKKGSGQTILKNGTNHHKQNKGGAP
jgi:hypothetical protein